MPQKFHNSELAVFKPLILKNFFNRHRLVRRRTQRFVHHPEGTVTDHALRFVTLNQRETEVSIKSAFVVIESEGTKPVWSPIKFPFSRWEKKGIWRKIVSRKRAHVSSHIETNVLLKRTDAHKRKHPPVYVCAYTEQNARNARKKKKNTSKLRIFKQRGKKPVQMHRSPHVARIFSRRAPSGHHVANLVRVALESIAFVFLFVF